MGKLAKAIAQDLREARDEQVLKGEEHEENGLEGSVADALDEIFAEEEDIEEERFDKDQDEEEEDDDEEEEEEASEEELYNTIYEYPMAMGGFILNCKELLEKYPDLHQHRMFLLGGVMEYEPENPSSPITNTFYNYWSFFDAQIGNTSETLATVVKETALDDAEDDAIALLDVGIRSKLGLYEHCGEEATGILLKEMGTDKIFHVVTPRSYQGKTGEIWLVRLLPPLEHLDYHTTVATPYILNATYKAACQQFIQSAGTIDGNWKWGDVVACMKHGPTPGFWLDYLKEAKTRIDPIADVIWLDTPPIFPSDVEFNLEER